MKDTATRYNTVQQKRSAEKMYINEKRSPDSVQDLKEYVISWLCADLKEYVRARAKEHLCEMRPVYVKIDLQKRPEKEPTKESCKTYIYIYVYVQQMPQNGSIYIKRDQ